MDLATLALSLTRDQFKARYDCLFLCSDLGVARPDKPQRTAVFAAEENTASMAQPLPGPPFAAPLIKVQDHFPSMITLGRTQNNDVVVADTSISKFHAFFRVGPGLFEVADAGSRNGTFIGERRLDPKVMARLKPGEYVRFARLSFRLLDASDCWDWLIRRQDDWG
jgi:FHA domain